MKRIRFIVIFVLVFHSVGHSQNNKETSVTLFHRSQQALTDVIVHDIFSPPVASRIYAYANIAAYEVMSKSQKNFVSLKELRVGFPVIPPTNEVKIDFPLAATYSFLKTAKRFIFSEARWEDSVKVILSAYKTIVRDSIIYKASIEYGDQVAESIGVWSANDQYRETRARRRYTFKRSEGHWTPTPPAYISAVEPYWGSMRTLAIDSSAQFAPPVPATYSLDSSSEFYRQAREVYVTGVELTPEQRAIAMFWDCNPFFVNTSGHLVFATKKLSPGGHWISIAGIASRNRKCDLMQSVAAYTFTAIALYDGFISCWEEKYKSNYIRPETFINSHIDESWRPLLQTPPFPEYTSGHSVISNAAATVLTKMFGPSFSFADDTELPYGLPVRNFSSFTSAAEEAAISRLYGGIHFRNAVVNGQTQGKALGDYVVQRLQIKALQ